LNNDEKDNILLEPINELIWKFNNLKKAMEILMFLSLPAAVISAILFAVIAMNSTYSLQTALFFSFFLFSAITSIVAIMFFPSALSRISNRMEITVQNISFTITPPKGKSPEEKLLNQLIRTDKNIQRVSKKYPTSIQINNTISGRSGKKYTFAVYINSKMFLGKYFDNNLDMQVFAKRFDESSPVNISQIKDVRKSIVDCLLKIDRKVPSRVLIVSTSGFEDDVFEYVRTKDSYFTERFYSTYCDIELIKEKVDGSFDVLSF